MYRLLQFTLDLFAPADAAPAPVPSPSRKSGPPRKKTPRATPAPDTLSQDPGPQLIAQSLDQVLLPASFRHPQANREAIVDGSHVAYLFRRGRRRTIGFSVGPEGLLVAAPKWVPLHEVDSALKEKASWVLKKLQETRDRHERIESQRIEWGDGASFPFLGETVIVVLDPRHDFREAGAVLNTDAAALPGVPHLTLHVGLPQTANPAQVRDAVQAWLMRQAKRIFVERLEHFAPLLGVRWNKLSLSSAGTRWGTAHSDGSIRLNWRLVHFRMPVIDYVVAHELSHLRVMDHSPRFWDTVRTVVPDYAQLRGQLKDESLPPW